MPLHLYTDGSCIGNPGPGAWAFLLKSDGAEPIRGQDGALHTTNNRMELLAVIQGLRTAESLYPNEKTVTVYSDSSWVINTMKLGWKRKKNLDLWRELDPLARGKMIRWEWVKGHAGHPENEDCDGRAQTESRRQLKLLQKLSPAQRRALLDGPTSEEVPKKSISLQDALF